MKKVTLIALLLVVFTACQKADIRPRTGCSEATTEAKSISVDCSNPNSGNSSSNSLGGGDSETTSTVDPNNPDSNGGEITDPLRKKDQKDNK